MRDRRGQFDMAHPLGRTRDSVTSTEHFSQMMPLYFMRCTCRTGTHSPLIGPKMRAQNKPSRSA